MLKRTALILAALGAPALAQPHVAQPAPASASASASAPIEALRGELLKMFSATTREAHVPGAIFGLVKDGQLVLVESLGVRDPAGGRPVDPDTRFRIASMSKLFTALAILKLRDEGKLSLEDPVARHVSEVAKWKMPTTDSPPIRIRDLLHHTSGLVEDNPWGDRQQVLSEAAFSAIIAAGTDLASTPGTRFEYSNYGYALLGRIISNVSGQRYQDYIRNGILLPLGMRSTGYDVATSPAGSRAIGYRWQDNKWVREPDMADGAFGAMGGIETSAHDYARWMTFLLSAWPASNTPDTGPVRRASVRETIGLLSPGEPSERPGFGGAACRIDTGYGMGLFVFNDCELGRVARHTGGYPGYGSAMVLLPDAGVGMFTFNARTYFSNNATVMAALLRLRRAGAITDRSLPVAPGLANAYAHARTAWQSGSLNGIPLAMNVPLDEALPRRTAAIAALKQKLGACDMSSAIAPISAMEGRFQWSCAQGTLLGRVQRAPTATVELQVLEFTERK